MTLYINLKIYIFKDILRIEDVLFKSIYKYIINTLHHTY